MPDGRCVDRNPAHGLGRIDVENDAAVATGGRNGLDVRQDTGLVVRVHERHERGVRTDRGDRRIGLDAPLRVGFQPGDLESLALELAARVLAGAMLDARGHDVTAVRCGRARGAQDREIDALRGARGEHDGFRRRIHQASDLPARDRDARRDCPAGRVR